jgi:hypothetical protein
MPTTHDFVFAVCQATLFTPDEEVSSAKIISGLLPQWASRFDGEPVVLPFPGAVPREVPRVILQDKTEMWRCEISSARMNIFWRRTSAEGQIPSSAEFFGEAGVRLTEYQNFQRARVGRVAAVVNRFVPQETPGVFLARHFCQDRWLTAPLNRPESFELHAHKKYDLAGFRLNSWVRNKSGELLQPDGRPPRPVLVVEQDLNTLPEDEPTRSFSGDEIRRFYEVVVPELDHILGLYFPTVV